MLVIDTQQLKVLIMCFLFMSPSLVWLPITVSFFCIKCIFNQNLSWHQLLVIFGTAVLRWGDEVSVPEANQTLLDAHLLSGKYGDWRRRQSKPLISIRSFTVQRQDGVRGMFLHYDREMGLLHVRWATQRPDNLHILTTQSPTQTYPLQM